MFKQTVETIQSFLSAGKLPMLTEPESNAMRDRQENHLRYFPKNYKVKKTYKINYI